eukprot:122787_1
MNMGLRVVVVVSVFVYVCWCKTGEILATGGVEFDETVLGQNDDINVWLKENKLESLSQQFFKDDISVNDLILLKYKDLQRFCADYHMKTIIETRFIAAIKKLKGKQHRIIITEAEEIAMQSAQKVIEELNENVELLNKQMKSINTKKVTLTNEINKHYDQTIEKLNKQRNILLSELDNMSKKDIEKWQNTSQKITQLDNEYATLSEHWDDMLSESNLNRDERKKQIVQQSESIVEKSNDLTREITYGNLTNTGDFVVNFTENPGVFRGFIWFSESNIVTNYTERQLLNNLLSNEFKKNNMIFTKSKLLYDSTKHSTDSKAFHSKCDGFGNTVTIIHTEYQHVFGIFTRIPWSSRQSGDMPKSRYIAYNGKYYATIGGVDPFSEEKGCEKEFYSMPKGWNIANPGKDTTFVSNNYPWGTSAVVYGDPNANANKEETYSGTTQWNSTCNTCKVEFKEPNQYKSAACSTRVLITKSAYESWKTDNSAFLFLLRSKFQDSKSRIINLKDDQDSSRYAMYCSDYGPTVGYGHDIHIGTDTNNASVNASTYSFHGNELCGGHTFKDRGQHRFNISSYEVYQMLTDETL